MINAVKRRDIKGLFHFTRLVNLESILQEGLVPRQELQRWHRPPVFNDQHRLDNQIGATCLSIGHPNYKMFYQIRRNNPTVEWVVLGLKKSILWEKDCAFCVENAAHARVTRVPIEHRKGVAAFNALFGEIGGAQPRAVLRIPDHYPTNPQAEVLVFDEIEPRYIMGALCPSNQMKEELAARYTDFQFIHSNGAFSYRSDFEHWR